MKKLLYTIGCLCGMLLSFTACNEKEEGMTTTGYLELGVSENIEVITRSADVANHSLAVDICDAVKDTVVKHFTDYNDIAGERILLNVGSYKVKVTSNPAKKMEFEKPSFYGESEKVVVKAGETTNVAVECFLSCVKVTTEFTKPVRDKFASCVAKISDDTQSYLEYSMTESRAGYYKPGFLLVNLTLTNKEGLTFNMSKLIEDTEARDHYHLIFDLIASGDDNSGMDFDISIETDPTNDENHTVTIPLPGTGYEQQPPVVEVLENQVAGDGIISIDHGDKTAMTVQMSSKNIGLNSVRMVSASSLFEDKKIPTSLDLLNLSDEDKVKLEEVGLIVPALEDKKGAFDLVFDDLIAKLPGGTHSFVLSVRDEMGHETVQTLSITINLQIMTHPVVVSEVWAHYATLRGYVKNATEAAKGDYKFQYRKANTEDEWQVVSGDVTVGMNGSSNVTQIVTNLEASTSYEYRLLQDEAIAESEEFITEEAAELPYGDFENAANGPWNTGTSSYWSSGNNTFVSDLCAQYKEGGNTMACLKSKKSVKFAAGNAFTGSFELVMMSMSGKITLGKSFTGRPNKLTGRYLYNPKTVNEGGDKIEIGAQDQCAIQIVLLTEPILLDTNVKETLDWRNKYKDKIIAVSELPTNEVTTSTWDTFSLVLDYWKYDVKPTYIGVICSSSKYGDYFQGAGGSELYIDDFKLEYSQAPTE